MLKCGHTICRSCIARLSGGKYAKCPTCRGELVVMAVNTMLAEYGEKMYNDIEAKRAARDAAAAAAAAGGGGGGSSAPVPAPAGATAGGK